MAVEDTKLAEGMREYAEQAVLVAKKHHQLDLDYSLASVESVEKLLDGAAKMAYKWQLRILRRKKREELANRLALVYGAYLGEVIRKEWGGVWHVGAEPPFDGIACITFNSGVTVAPTARAYKRITAPDLESVVSYINAIPSIIENAGS